MTLTTLHGVRHRCTGGTDGQRLGCLFGGNAGCSEKVAIIIADATISLPPCQCTSRLHLDIIGTTSKSRTF